MNHSILKARREVNNKLSNLRSIDRIINSEKFDILYSHANDHDENVIIDAITNECRDTILNWIKNKSREIDYNEVNIKELHIIARRLGISNYTRMPKALLLYEINQRKTSKSYDGSIAAM